MLTQFVLFPVIQILAYLDPGSGSIILQLILAAILGVGVLFRLQWKKIKALFGHKDSENDKQDDEE